MTTRCNSSGLQPKGLSFLVLYTMGAMARIIEALVDAFFDLAWRSLKYINCSQNERSFS